MGITFNLLVTRPKSANGKFSTCRFFFSAAKKAAEKKAKATKYQTFGCFFLPLLGNFERHYLWAIQIFQDFSSHNPRNFDKGPWIENGERFTILSSTCQSGAKVEWRVSSSEYCWIAAIILEISTKDLGLRTVNDLLFFHQPVRVAQKSNDVSAAANTVE